MAVFLVWDGRRGHLFLRHWPRGRSVGPSKASQHLQVFTPACDSRVFIGKIVRLRFSLKPTSCMSVNERIREPPRQRIREKKVV